MKNLLKAIRYRSLDEARGVLRQIAPDANLEAALDDGDEEPAGLLSVIPEDRIPEEYFIRLFDLGKGTLVEVERIRYSGFGPPAADEGYMGFASEGIAYLMPGSRLPIEIEGCSYGAVDFHHLDALVLDGSHPIDPDQVRRALNLPEDWDFDLLFEKICDGELTAQEIDRIIHQGIQ